MLTFAQAVGKLTFNKPCIAIGLVDNGPIKVRCPYCHNNKYTTKGCSSTLVGSIGGPNPNHFTCYADCQNCKKQFVYHHKHLDSFQTNVWYVDKNVVIDGISNCCNSQYKYQCKCGGLLSIFITDLNGNRQDYYVMSYGKSKQYHEYLHCDKCGTIEEFDG